MAAHSRQRSLTSISALHTRPKNTPRRHPHPSPQSIRSLAPREARAKAQMPLQTSKGADAQFIQASVARLEKNGWQALNSIELEKTYHFATYPSVSVRT
jgi:hypothetical protein